ncbi:MAG: DUF6320 domain-containing protein [Sphaerochaetaceae bacterium]
MAYCVKCGVKLPGGARQCPLCLTDVVLPPGMTEPAEKPLFKEDSSKAVEHGLDKTRKAILEITVIIAVVAEVVVGVAMLPDASAFLPMLCILYAAVAFLIPVLAERPSFVLMCTLEAAATAILVLLIDMHVSGGLFWSLIAAASMALAWILGVLPFILKKHLAVCILVQVAGLASYLLLIDGLYPPIDWVIEVGWPVLGFVVALGGLFVLRLKVKALQKATAVDMVFSCFSIVCLTVGFADWASTGFKHLNWSLPVWTCGITLFILEVLISAVRRIRDFFNTRNAQRRE